MTSQARQASVEVQLKDPDTQAVYMRSGITVAFFLASPIASLVAPLREATKAYLASIPPNALKWESIGASSDEWRPIKSTATKRCLAPLEEKASDKRILTMFELADDADAPGYALTVVGS
jgi:hypothetical protein